MKYHFIGDQGVSMKSLKEYLAARGETVTGSDLKTTGHKAENITADIDIVVRTSAVNPGSLGWVEVERAQELGIKIIKRSELLAQITEGKKVIAVAGMHGKTTITSLVSLLLIEAGFDPTVFVGERVPSLGGAWRAGKSEWVVVEACEYDRSFMDLHPNIIILTNIEEEHLDTYPKGLAEIKTAFGQFLDRIDPRGKIIACYDDQNIRSICHDRESMTIYYGFTAKENNKLDHPFALPGKHNRQNALAVVALASLLGIGDEVLANVLANFHGAARRFELKGQYKGANIIDDYGHHPTEIAATISAMRECYPGKKLIVVFWPHQYRRIKPFLHQFAMALSQANEVILKPIFLVPGRDEELDVSSKQLSKLIQSAGLEKVSVMSDDELIVKHLRDELDSKTVLLTIGIPPVYKIAEMVIGKNSD